MDKSQAVAWLKSFNDKIQENKAYLSDLDTPIGDGDHGNNMARGMTACMEALEKESTESASDVLKIAAMQLLSKVGGASGPLYGSAFLGMSKAADQSLAEMIQAGAEQIMHRGKAAAGEKTMLDVWLPAGEALANEQLTTETIDDLIEATKDMKATKGRASYLGERSIGHIDPGAASSGLLFEALIEALAGDKHE
ncbi:MAG: dihydroxyacetone kinase subunit L [Aerococcus sp.]|nr:dihydroxyacetone kinase subunit L [Aerococcus sp.]